jgi:hypothetical protein
MAKVDVGIPIPLGNYSYLPPVQTGMNDAEKEKAMNPLLAWLAGQGIDVAAEKTGIKDVLRERGSGLLEMFGIGNAQAAETPEPPPVQTGFQPVPPTQPSVIGELVDKGFTPPGVAEAPAPSVPGEKFAGFDYVLPPEALTDVQLPPVTVAANAPQGEDYLNQRPIRENPLVDWMMADTTDPVTDREVDKVIKSEPEDSLLGRLWDSTLGDEEWRLRKAMILNSMRLNPDAALTQAFAARIKDLRQEKRGNRTAQVLREKGYGDAAALIEQFPELAGDILKSVDLTGGKTTGFKTLEQRAAAAGLSPGTQEYADFMKTGGQGLQSLQVGTIPQGMQLVQEGGAYKMVPIPGGPADVEAQEAARKELGRQVQRARAGTTVIQDLQRGLDKFISEVPEIAREPGIAGANLRLARQVVPGTAEYEIKGFVESALSNVGLDTLQQMRENSPTGGALGQVPIQQQKRLEQVLGSLSLGQSPETIEANLKRVINIYIDIVYGSPAERAEAVRSGKMDQTTSDQIDAYYHSLPFDPLGRPVQAPAPEKIGVGETVDVDGTSIKRIN